MPPPDFSDHEGFAHREATESAVEAIDMFRDLTVVEALTVEQIHEELKSYGLQELSYPQTGGWSDLAGKPGVPTGALVVTADAKVVSVQVGWQGTYYLFVVSDEAATAELTDAQLRVVTSTLGVRGTYVEIFEHSHHAVGPKCEAWLQWLRRANPDVEAGAEQLHQMILDAKAARSTVQQSQWSVRVLLGKVLSWFWGRG